MYFVRQFTKFYHVVNIDPIDVGAAANGLVTHDAGRGWRHGT